MIDKSDYVDFLDSLDNISRVARISFRESRTPEVFKTEETLFAAFLAEAEEFEKYWKEITESKVFKHYTELPHFKIHHKKAVKFWRAKHEIKFKTFEEFARDAVQKWFETPEHYRDDRWFSINMTRCYWIDGMPCQTVLNSVLVMAQNEFEPTITTAEAKKAAEYLQKHQTELLKQRDILDRYLKQQGFTGSSFVYGSFKKRYQEREEGTKDRYLIEPDLLRAVLKQQDTKTITAKRAAGSLFSLDTFVRRNPPISAITELSNLTSGELVSDDTVSRHVKTLINTRNSLKIHRVF